MEYIIDGHNVGFILRCASTEKKARETLIRYLEHFGQRTNIRSLVFFDSRKVPRAVGLTGVKMLSMVTWGFSDNADREIMLHLANLSNVERENTTVVTGDKDILLFCQGLKSVNVLQPQALIQKLKRHNHPRRVY